MSHHLGPPAAIAANPIARRDRLIRLTARLVGRLLLPTARDQPPTAAVEHEQDRSGGSPSSGGCTPQRGGSR
jgi:hypothetical protein